MISMTTVTILPARSDSNDDDDNSAAAIGVLGYSEKNKDDGDDLDDEEYDCVSQ